MMSSASTLTFWPSRRPSREPDALQAAETFGLDGPAIPDGLVRTWRKRIRFRRHLARLSQDGPALVEDIGLTMKQVEAELRKPFWRR
jgi:uncharacterized protein YjiS (DUF1127 family)